MDQCDNEFCLHHEVNDNTLAEWNKTKCYMFEIDPYDNDNKGGFDIKNCPARIRYRKFGW